MATGADHNYANMILMSPAGTVVRGRGLIMESVKTSHDSSKGKHIILFGGRKLPCAGAGKYQKKKQQ